MRLWTIQNEIAYKKFKVKGTLSGDKKFIYDDMLFHYNWMTEQMKKRIGLPSSEKIKYPIWAWYQWRGEKYKIPDLRFAGHLEKGTKGVLLELEVEAENVLLSDFGDFNIILNYGYMADNEKEYDNFYNELNSYGFKHHDLQLLDTRSDLLEQFKLRLYDSWEKVFDLERGADEEWSGKKTERAIQAVIWEINWEQVVSVKHFIAN